MYKFNNNADNIAYDEAVRAEIGVAPLVKIVMGFNAIEAMTHNLASATPKPWPSVISGTNLTTDTDLEKPYTAAFATLEEDFWLLDGSKRKLATQNVPADPREAFGVVLTANNENELSGADGVFATPPALTLTFDQVSTFLGASISWWHGTTAGLGSDEYAIKFKIETFSYAGELLRRYIVDSDDPNRDEKDNTSVDWGTFEPFQSVKKMTITVLKWSRPSRRARIEKAELGFSFSYEGDMVKEITHKAEGNPLSLTLPSGELQFTILDTSGEFNSDNPNGKYQYLTQNQPVNVSISQEVKKNGEKSLLPVPIGTFFLDDWYDGQNESEYVFVAKDIQGLLDKKKFFRGKPFGPNGSLPAAIPVSEWLEFILDDADLTLYAQGMWQYSDDVKAMKIVPIMPECSHRDAVQYVCNACGVTAYVDRHGKLDFRKRSDERFNYIIDADMQMGRFVKPSRVPPLARTIENYSVYYIEEDDEAKAKDFTITAPTSGDPIKSYLSLKGLVRVESVQVPSGVTYEVMSCGVEFTVPPMASGQFTATITSVKLTEARGQQIIQNKDRYEQDIVGEDLEVDNPLVLNARPKANETDAIYLANWHNEEAISRQIYELEVMADPRIDIGDILKLYRPSLDEHDSPDKTILVRVLNKEYVLNDSSESMKLTVRGGKYE